MPTTNPESTKFFTLVFVYFYNYIEVFNSAQNRQKNANTTVYFTNLQFFKEIEKKNRIRRFRIGCWHLMNKIVVGKKESKGVISNQST